MLITVTQRTFNKEVLQSPAPVLVHFWAPWCGLCKMLNPMLLKFQSECYGNVKIVGINADENFHLATTYRLTSLPTLILFEQGEMVERLDGIFGRDDIRITLNQILLQRMPKTA